MNKLCTRCKTGTIFYDGEEKRCINCGFSPDQLVETVWDDELHRYRPVSSEDIRLARRVEARHNSRIKR